MLLKETEQCSPLWAVANRISIPWIESTEKRKAVLDYFLSRDEDVNDLCGPYGTMLHAAIAHSFHHLSAELLTALNLLTTSYGANASVIGPRGNALDFFFELYSGLRDEFRDLGYLMLDIDDMRLKNCLEYLVEQGAVPQRPDANGHIPTIDEMRITLNEDDKEHRRRLMAKDSVESAVTALRDSCEEAGVTIPHKTEVALCDLIEAAESGPLVGDHPLDTEMMGST